VVSFSVDATNAVYGDAGGAREVGGRATPWPQAVGGEIHRVPVSSLLAGFSPRLYGVDAEHVQLLAQAPAPLPPILVQRGTMRVIDGMHRLCAARRLGRETIDVRFVDGTEAEMFAAAVKANTEHGLPLTLADRKAAASRLIALLPRQSDRWIADVTGLAPRTIAAVRRRHGQAERDGTRVGRDGRERPVDIAERRRIAKDAIIADPGASLRTIAAAAGLSPGTVRDVRQRLARGEDPVTRKPPGGERQAKPAAPPRLSPPRPRDHHAVVGQARDRAALLRDLRRDPSLRFTERGRRLLEWLAVRAAGPSGLDALIDALPAHCCYLVAGLARKCADEWLEVARRLEQRGGPDRT
jgi:ParB-like chromosome segregation protein Spo0J